MPGDANNTFRCNNVSGHLIILNQSLTIRQVDLYDFVTHADLGSTLGRGAGSWGWTSPEGREFVAIAQKDGAAFAEITSKGKLVYLGRLPQFSDPSIWREIKGYQSYVMIGSEAVGHGVQIFDMSKVGLRECCW